MLKFHLSDHRGYVVNSDTTAATGLQFNLPGHCLADLSISIKEQVKRTTQFIKKNVKNSISEDLTHYTED